MVLFHLQKISRIGKIGETYSRLPLARGRAEGRGEEPCRGAWALFWGDAGVWESGGGSGCTTLGNTKRHRIVNFKMVNSM